MKLLHQFVAALFFIYHAYATTSNTEPCEKKDDSGTFLFICLVVGFFIIKHSEDKRREYHEASYDSDEDEEELDSGDEADTEEEGDDASESEEETEQEEDDSDAEESEEEIEVKQEPPTRKSRRLGSKATLADSHS